MDPPSAPAPAPRDIQVDRAAGTLAVAWADLRHVFRLAQLRGCCDCAHCVNEWTGERLLDLASIPPDIVIERLELVGNYAIRPYWSDGHCSGLFTWQRLRSLAEAKS